MRRTVLILCALFAAAVIGVMHAPAYAADDAVNAEDLFGESDVIITREFPNLGAAYAGGTAAYSDPTGLIDFFEFSSLYPSVGTDRIAVFTCPAYGAVNRTAAEAAAIGNDALTTHFLAMSEGQYTVEFVAGGDIPVGSGASTTDCQNYAEANYSGPTVRGAVYISHISGGYAGPGSTCVLYFCSATWPQNSRTGFVTDSSLIAMVWAHEHGHMIGFPHSNSNNGSEYDNPIDLMSANARESGATSSVPYETTVANVLAAGWIGPSDVVQYSGGEIEVDLATTGASGSQMVAIEVSSSEFYAIGSRISDTNDPFPSSWAGAEVMYVGSCGSTCYPLDRAHITYGQVPWSGGDGKPFHMIAVGETATINGYLLEVLSKDGDSVRIRLSDPSVVVIPEYVERIAGADRYATAAEVSKAAFPDAGAVSKVFVATGADFPDALGAAAAAGHLGGPVLLVNSGVPGPTATELARLNPDTIYVVGGTSVISDAVKNSLAAYGTVVRLAGADRYATAAEVSKAAFPDAGAVSKVFVATGADFPDALGAAAAAGHLGGPVLLVNSGVPGPTATELARLNPDTIYVVGGTSVISDVVKNSLAAYGTVVRLAGADRYATAAEVSKAAFPDAGAVSKVFVATGADFPDALGAAAAAGHLGGPVLLVNDDVPAPTAVELARLKPATVYVVGGTSVISNTVASKL